VILCIKIEMLFRSKIFQKSRRSLHFSKYTRYHFKPLKKFYHCQLISFCKEREFQPPLESDYPPMIVPLSQEVKNKVIIERKLMKRIKSFFTFYYRLIFGWTTRIIERILGISFIKELPAFKMIARIWKRNSEKFKTVFSLGFRLSIFYVVGLIMFIAFFLGTFMVFSSFAENLQIIEEITCTVQFADNQIFEELKKHPAIVKYLKGDFIIEKESIEIVTFISNIAKYWDGRYVVRTTPLFNEKIGRGLDVKTYYYIKDSDYTYVRPDQLVINDAYKGVPLDDNIIVLARVELEMLEDSSILTIPASFFSKSSWSAMQTYIDVQSKILTDQFTEFNKKMKEKGFDLDE